MTDTAFKLDDNLRSRLAGMHRRGPDGSLETIPYEVVQDPEFHMGGAGLYGTAVDYIRFNQMILNKGRGATARVLEPATVELMCRNNIGNLSMNAMRSSIATATNDVDFYPKIEKKWGISYMINTAPTPEGRSAGSLSWAGLANTYYWIDPKRKITGVLMMQVLPFADKRCLDVFSRFEAAIYAALNPASMPS
jgi:methyl acetate hydrolase